MGKAFSDDKEVLQLDVHGRSLFRSRKNEEGERGVSYTKASIYPTLVVLVIGSLAIFWILRANAKQREEIAGYIQNRDVAAVQLGAAEVTPEAERLAATMIAEHFENATLTPTAYVEPLDLAANPAKRDVTATPTATITSTAIPSIVPTEIIAPATPGGFQVDMTGLAKYSWYWPPYGGINCQPNCEIMANGENWRDYIDKAVACPDAFPYETKIRLAGDPKREYVCKDRGGAIVVNDDGTFWIDVLRPDGEFIWSTIIYVEIDVP